MDILYPKNEAEFTEFLQVHPMVVVDLYSTDCPPCNRLAPIYEKIAQQHPSVAFVKIHRQEFRDLAESFHILSSPTVLFFHRNVLQKNRLAGDIQENDLQLETEQIIQREHALVHQAKSHEHD